MKGRSQEAKGHKSTRGGRMWHGKQETLTPPVPSHRQVSNYQTLAFELNAFCLETPVAFPQYILLDVNKQIAQG